MKELRRTTKETDIIASLNLYGSGKGDIDTGVGFFDHMLSAFCKHSLIDLSIKCSGDTHIDAHHSVEDCGIVIGQLLKDEIYPASNIERFSNSIVVMDEAAVECVIDVSNRPFLVYECDVLRDKVGDFDTELSEEFFRAIVFNAGLSVHIIKQRGKNAHHIIEAAFKAFAVALRRAVAKNDRTGDASTKGVL